MEVSEVWEGRRSIPGSAGILPATLRQRRNGVRSTSISVSYTWSEAERVVDRTQLPRVCNMRGRKEVDTEPTDKKFMVLNFVNDVC